MADSDNSSIILNDVLLMAVAEQVAGIIVGCMPVMPAFYRHFFGPSQQPSYESREKGRRLRYANFSIGGGGSGNSKRKGQSKDPYRITTVNGTTFEELDEIEAGKSYGTKDGSVVTVDNNPFASSLDTVRENQELPADTAGGSKPSHAHSGSRDSTDLPIQHNGYGLAQ